MSCLQLLRCSGHLFDGIAIDFMRIEKMFFDKIENNLTEYCLITLRHLLSKRNWCWKNLAIECESDTVVTHNNKENYIPELLRYNSWWKIRTDSFWSFEIHIFQLGFVLHFWLRLKVAPRVEKIIFKINCKKFISMERMIFVMNISFHN